MSFLRAVFCLLLSAEVMISVDAHGQARGPSGSEIRDTGKKIEGPHSKPGSGKPEVDAENERQVREIQAWLAQLPGRFRIQGQVELIAQNSRANRVVGSSRNQSAAISGNMDCTAIGDGVGVSCIVNASWPFFESSVGPNAEPPPAERINTFRPALLVLGFSTDPPLVRGILATANDSFSTTGKLDGSSVKSMNRSSCWDECVSFIEISVTADGNIATLTLRPPGAEARIVAHRDPNARAQEALKSMKAR